MKKVTAVVKFLKVCKDKGLPKSIVIVKLSDPPDDPARWWGDGGRRRGRRRRRRGREPGAEQLLRGQRPEHRRHPSSMLADIVKKEGAEKVAVTWSARAPSWPRM